MKTEKKDGKIEKLKKIHSLFNELPVVKLHSIVLVELLHMKMGKHTKISN